MERFIEKPENGYRSKLTIGWIGSSATLHYLEDMKEILDMIYDLHPEVQLKIVGNTFFDCERMPTIKKEWNYDEEITDLHSFDIGLMPLTDDPWSRGKCGFKLLQYMAVGIPAVSSPVGVNKEIIKDGENGMLAESKESWINKLSLLLKDGNLRRDIGKRGRIAVMNDFSAKKNVIKLIKIFKSLQQ
jgi:glycosyltransferase involved in cell wall biosynthesis